MSSAKTIEELRWEEIMAIDERIVEIVDAFCHAGDSDIASKIFDEWDAWVIYRGEVLEGDHDEDLLRAYQDGR
ncbi:MAG: hypothetical protein OXI05_01195 [Bacteroidota bacterium]|nr:hypothetical protein [Bacteroidota bacterium]